MYTCGTFMVRNTKQDIRKDIAHVLGQIQGRLMDGEVATAQASLGYGGSSYVLMDMYVNEDAPTEEGRLLSGQWQVDKTTNPVQIAWKMVRQMIK